MTNNTGETNVPLDPWWAPGSATISGRNTTTPIKLQPDTPQSDPARDGSDPTLPLSTSRNTIGALTSLLLASACGQHAPPDNTAPATVSSGDTGFYSQTQAARGRDVFQAVCSECHVSGDFRGPDFEWTWRRQTAWDLYESMAESMPEDSPGSLSPETYTAVIAYILQINEYAAGSRDLAPVQESLDSVPLGPDVDKTGRSNPTGDG